MRNHDISGLSRKKFQTIIRKDPLGLRRTSRFDGSAPGKGPSCTRIHHWVSKVILGISIEEHQTLMKDLSPLATGKNFQANYIEGKRQLAQRVDRDRSSAQAIFFLFE